MSWFSSLFRRSDPAWHSAAPFRGLAKPERRLLERSFKCRSVEAGTLVTEEGTRADELIYVQSGVLELLKKDPRTGTEHQVGTVRAGQVLGEHALLDGKPRAASARASSDSLLWVLPFEQLRQKAAEPRASQEKRIYQDLVLGLAQSLAGRMREHVDLSLEHARERAVMGQFIVNVLILVCAYVLFLNALPFFWGRISDTTETVSLPLIAVFGVASWRFIQKSGYPLSHFGIGLKHLFGSLLEAGLLTLPFAAVVTGLKLLVLWTRGSTLPVFEHTDVAARMHEPNVLLWIRIYAATALVQELIVRGVLQSSLERFLTGPGRRTRAIVVCALLFSISHLHISYLFSLLAIVPGLFWGWLYSRRPNLVGVSLSHIIVGCYVFFILGITV